MANHVTNKLTISGPQELLQQFARQVKGVDADGEESEFSLHMAVPQPEVITRTEDGPTASLGLWLVDEELHKKLFLDDPMDRIPQDVLKTIEENMPARFSRYARCACASREEAKAWAEANQPELLELGEAMAEAYREYGYHDWYKWRIAKWGTQWETYRVTREDQSSDTHLLYFFDTAWSPPSPAIATLAEKFPALTLEHKFFDELSNFWGSDLYREGKLAVSREDLDEDRIPLCIELFGHDPTEDVEAEKPAQA